MTEIPDWYIVEKLINKIIYESIRFMEMVTST